MSFFLLGHRFSARVGLWDLLVERCCIYRIDNGRPRWYGSVESRRWMRDGHVQGGGAICHVDRPSKGLIFNLHLEDGLVEDDPYM